jgi:hypothetical protein
VTLEIYLQAEIGQTERCTWRSDSGKFGDALEGDGRANLEAVIERFWTCTWRL